MTLFNILYLNEFILKFQQYHDATAEKKWEVNEKESVMEL